MSAWTASFSTVFQYRLLEFILVSLQLFCHVSSGEEQQVFGVLVEIGVFECAETGEGQGEEVFARQGRIE